MLYFRHMKNIICAMILFFAVAGPAKAVELKTIETDYLWDTVYSSFTSLTSKTVDVCGYGTIGFSTASANCLGFSYALLSAGGEGQFTITHTTKTFSTPLAGSVAGFNNSAPAGLSGANLTSQRFTTGQIGIPSGSGYNGKFEATAINPVFTFTSLSPSGTYYLWVEIGRQKRR